MKIELELEPFSVPEFVEAKLPAKLPLGKEGGWVPQSFPLASADAETLGQLCDQFRASVFQKAGKEDPQLNYFRSLKP